MKAEPTESYSVMGVPILGSFSPDMEARRLFAFLKSGLTPQQSQSRSITFELPDKKHYQLVPLTSRHASDVDVLNDLMTWRRHNKSLFLDSIEPTIDSTRVWLEKWVLLNEDRVLFLVQDEHGKRLGHLGLWTRDGWRLELDNVIKNPTSTQTYLFTSAVKALGIWANEFLGSPQLYLRVMSTNEHAVGFYERLGFEAMASFPTDQAEPIRKEEIQHGKPVLNLAPESDPCWIVMQRDTESWYEQGEIVLTAGPSIGPVELSYTADAVQSGWNNHHSDYLQAFSESFGDYVEAKYVIPTDSCTSALHLALWALGVGPGDEVIVPEITWVATANAARYVGATPVFADVDPVTWCLDPNSVERLINSRTKAIMPVHLYGYVAPLDPLQSICEKYGLHLVQDAAPGIGSMYGSNGVASMGDFSCFSFQGAKLLVSGEGGVLTTNDEELFERAFKIGDSGRKPGTFWIEVLGKKMKMSNLTASLALAQLQSAERQITRKRQIRAWYADVLEGIEGVHLQQEAENTRSICWMTSVFVDRPGFDRDALRSQLLQNGIDTRPVFSPISRYPYWEQPRAENTVASKIGDNSINLPSGVRLSEPTIKRVAQTLKKLLEA